MTHSLETKTEVILDSSWDCLGKFQINTFEKGMNTTFPGIFSITSYHNHAFVNDMPQWSTSKAVFI